MGELTEINGAPRPLDNGTTKEAGGVNMQARWTSSSDEKEQHVGIDLGLRVLNGLVAVLTKLLLFF